MLILVPTHLKYLKIKSSSSKSYVYMSIELSEIELSLAKVKYSTLSPPQSKFSTLMFGNAWQKWNWTKFGKSEIQYINSFSSKFSTSMFGNA